MIKKILAAPDSFKGTMSSIEVCGIIEKGINNIIPEAEVIKLPIADGGEGTVDAFLTYEGGRKINVRVKGPLFREVDSFYGILPDGTAVIEMAAASGLTLVEGRKNPWNTTTYGTGQLILHALNMGCSKIILGVGGSATNDAGIGMAAALGARFLDIDGKEIPLTGGGLERLHSIDTSNIDRRLEYCQISAACDVDSPLYGHKGAAYVFAPQKGADSSMIKLLDNNLRKFSEAVLAYTKINLQEIAGTGAAGGLAAGLVAFTGAKLISGIDLIMEHVNFDKLIKDVDLIITGEGRIDEQSLAGKVPVGIARRAKKQNIPVIVIAGALGNNIDSLYEAGISAIFCTCKEPKSFEEIKATCRADMQRITEEVMRCIVLYK